MSNKKEFLKKLKQLLKEYNATICVDADDCSDWYGVYNKRMVIEIDDEVIKEVPGSYFDHKDL
jgi:hypothetical protein